MAFVSPTRLINTTAPLAGGGNLSADRTLTITPGQGLAVVGGLLRTVAEVVTVYATGTVYTLTNAAAECVFGTISPSLVIDSAGTWLIRARARVDSTASTLAATRTVTLLLRRTNNTAADLAGSPLAVKTPITAGGTFAILAGNLPEIVYTTTNANDIIQLYGLIDTVPTGGTVQVMEASIVAVRLY